MSTLSLEDFDTRMRRALGLEARCNCACTRTPFRAILPVIETCGPTPTPENTENLPGAAWLRTGLHRLRVPSGNVPRPCA
jgi:hypothetical protein